MFSVFLLFFSFLVFVFLRHLSLFENNAAFPRLGCKEKSYALDKKKGVSVKDTDSAFCAYSGHLSGIRTQVTLPTRSLPPSTLCSCLPEVSHGRQERERGAESAERSCQQHDRKCDLKQLFPQLCVLSFRCKPQTLEFYEFPFSDRVFSFLCLVTSGPYTLVLRLC